MTTPRENQNISEAIAAAETAEGDPPISLYASTIQLGELYVALKNMGVDVENILDLMRMPMMFAVHPSKPEAVTEAIGTNPKQRN